jgi:hypothetical protein
LVSFGVTTTETLPLSLKTLGAIPTRSTIFSTTCRYPYLQLDFIWLQNAVTASFVWKRSLARSRSGPASFGANASLVLFGVFTRCSRNTRSRSRSSTASRSALSDHGLVVDLSFLSYCDRVLAVKRRSGSTSD